MAALRSIINITKLFSDIKDEIQQALDNSQQQERAFKKKSNGFLSSTEMQTLLDIVSPALAKLEKLPAEHSADFNDRLSLQQRNNIGTLYYNAALYCAGLNELNPATIDLATLACEIDPVKAILSRPITKVKHFIDFAVSWYSSDTDKEEARHQLKVATHNISVAIKRANSLEDKPEKNAQSRVGKSKETKDTSSKRKTPSLAEENNVIQTNASSTIQGHTSKRRKDKSIRSGLTEPSLLSQPVAIVSSAPTPAVAVNSSIGLFSNTAATSLSHPLQTTGLATNQISTIELTMPSPST